MVKSTRRRRETVVEDTSSNTINIMAKPLTSEVFPWAPLMRIRGCTEQHLFIPRRDALPPAPHARNILKELLISRLVHLAHKRVDELFPIAVLAPLDEVQALLGQPTLGRRHLEPAQKKGDEKRSCTSTRAREARGENTLRMSSVARAGAYGHRNWLQGLKFGPTVAISWTRSSMQVMPYLPRFSLMMELSVIGRRCLFTHAKPRL